MKIMFNRASSNAWYVLDDTMQGETWLQSNEFGWVGLGSLTDRCKSVGAVDGGRIGDDDIGA